jgi:5-methyltetrahydrofolate--homocysteine methyltransferase
MKDASQNALAAARLLDKTEEQVMEHELDEKYEQLRAAYQQEQQKLLTIDEARRQKKDYFSE